MSVTIWDCDDTFWENRRFVTWQLLRRNQNYQEERKRLVQDRSIFLPKKSYPPSSVKEGFEVWRERLELFVTMVMESDKLRYFREAIHDRPLWTSGQVPFQNWLDKRELDRRIPYKDLVFGQFTRGGVSVPTQRLKELGLTTEVSTNNAISLMTIRMVKNTLKVTMPFHERSMELIVFPRLDSKVDFPPMSFLPRFSLLTPRPLTSNRKEYASYLYYQALEPYATGRGRPRVTKQALMVWDLSVHGKKDADIARELFGLEYFYPDKPAVLQRVHDLKKSAQKAIKAVYP